MQLYLLSMTALLTALQITCNAQTVKLINATEQDWAGGIAGHTGENYTFEIEFSDYIKEPLPLTLWVGQYAFSLQTNDSLRQKNTVIKHINRTNKLNIKITVGTFHNEYAEKEGQPFEKELLNNMPKPPKPFKGKALLSYLYKGAINTFEITEIRTLLPVQEIP